jgi:hypothetical protein
MYRFCTIYDILPENTEHPPKNNNETAAEIREVKSFLDESERANNTVDEVMFLALINRRLRYLEKQADIFKRAKTLLVKDRFTVEYKNPHSNSNPLLEDFEIIPIKKKSD